MKIFQIELDEYQVANLRWALEAINVRPEFNFLNTGDWVCEIKYKLEEIDTDFVPNALF